MKTMTEVLTSSAIERRLKAIKGAVAAGRRR
jgi:hypothetical protein